MHIFEEMKPSKTGAKAAIQTEPKTEPEDASSVSAALKRTVFVGNVPVGMHRRKLEALFRPCGTVESSRFRSITPAKPNLSPKAALLNGLWHPARDTCNAFVVFKDSASVERALALNGTRIDTDDGRQVHIRVDRCSLAPRRSRERFRNPCRQGSAVETNVPMQAPEGVTEEPLRAQWDHRRSIFLGNVPFDASEEEIRNLFSDCGPITNVRVVRDAQTGMGKGFAYVTFAPEANMDLALGRHETVQLRGRYLRVQRSSARLANRRMQGQVTIEPDARHEPGRSNRKKSEATYLHASTSKHRLVSTNRRPTTERSGRKRRRALSEDVDQKQRELVYHQESIRVDSPEGKPALVPSFAGQVADPLKSPFSRPRRRRSRTLSKHSRQRSSVSRAPTRSTTTSPKRHF